MSSFVGASRSGWEEVEEARAEEESVEEEGPVSPVRVRRYRAMGG